MADALGRRTPRGLLGVRESAPVSPNPTPTGVSIFPREPVRASRRRLEARYEHLVHCGVLDAGGHFAALEQPTVFVDEVRATFRELRRPQRARAATSGDRGPVALASFSATTW